jgi:hypothetical protein
MAVASKAREQVTLAWRQIILLFCSIPGQNTIDESFGFDVYGGSEF